MIVSKQPSETLEVEKRSAGQRLDNYLTRVTGGRIPRSRIYHMIRSGETRVNGARCLASTRLTVGDQVRIPPLSYPKGKKNLHSSPSVPQVPTNIILHEDEDLIAINKPSGLACHGGSGLKFGLIEQIRITRPQEKFLELVHRLDKDTSGITLIAKKRSILTGLHALFRDRKIDKRYLALVHGRWRNTFQRIQAALSTRRQNNEKRSFIDSINGRNACTEIFLLARGTTSSLVEAKPLSGRTHQIRVHLATTGHAIVGDEKYGLREHAPRLFLHAHHLSFQHPLTNQRMIITSPPPNDWHMILEQQQLTPYEKKDPRTIFSS